MSRTRCDSHWHLGRSRRRLLEKTRLARSVEQRLPGLVFERDPEFGPRLGSFAPATGSGTWHGRDFHFRFRYDVASLNVLVDGAEWVASRYDVTGEPYAGSLCEIRDLPQLLARLIVDLAPADAQDNPMPCQRLSANLDVLLGRTKDPIEP